MWNFISADKANLALSAETKFRIQKYDCLENIEKPSRALEVTLVSSPDTNLGHGNNEYTDVLSQRYSTSSMTKTFASSF